jgi:hypothetical protein
MKCVKVNYIAILPLQSILIVKINLQKKYFIWFIENSFHIENSKLLHRFFDQSHVYIYIYRVVYQSFNHKHKGNAHLVT